MKILKKIMLGMLFLFGLTAMSSNSSVSIYHCSKEFDECNTKHSVDRDDDGSDSNFDDFDECMRGKGC